MNAGGWLLLEPWITPKLFEEVSSSTEELSDCIALNKVNVGELQDKIVDEYTYAQYLQPEFYRQRLRLHWDSFLSRRVHSAVVCPVPRSAGRTWPPRPRPGSHTSGYPSVTGTVLLSSVKLLVFQSVLCRYWNVSDALKGKPFPPPNLNASDPFSPLFYLKRALGWVDELNMKVLHSSVIT